MDPSLQPVNSTWPALAQDLCGIAAFALYFLAPGYVWGGLTDVVLFRTRSHDEQVLWSVALSLPLGIAICALLGRVVPPSGINLVFGALDLLAVFLWWRARRPEQDRAAAPDPLRRWMLLLMALFGLYCIVATVDIEVRHGLYVSTVIQDWSVRVQMVKAAMRSGVPPINGLTTVSGALSIGEHAPHFRYYYFWYVAVAQMARTFHVPAAAALAASCAWAGWALLATFFLGLKYFIGVRERLRAKCFLGLLVIAVLGLDILPTAWLWLRHNFHPYVEMEWWHQDRTPSFLGSVLYAPHHMAGFACLLAGFLVLLLSMRSLAESASAVSPKFRVIAAGVFAGIAFAAAAGTALFPTFCFVFVLGGWAIDLLRRKEWGTLAALAGSGLLALLLAHGYLRELSEGSSAASGFASFRWRNDDFIAGQLARHHKLVGHGPLFSFLLRQPAVLLLDFFDLGFYTLVLIAAVRQELLPRTRLNANQCAWWALVLGAAVPFFFLSSTATSGPNDLGVDAGFLLRLGLQLWAVPWVWRLWHEWKARRVPAAQNTGRSPLSFTFAAALFLLGLSAQFYQVLSVRLYYAVVGTGLVHKQMDAFTQDHLAQRLYNVRTAWRAFDAQVPPSAPDTEAVQFNPVGTMQPAETLYSNHQIAAWDTGCGTSYGGDYKSCAPIYSGLLFLYGNTQHGVDTGRAQNDRQDGTAPRVANAQDFAAMCRTLHLRAIMAESTDPIWNKTDSWVWTAPVMVSNDTVRVLACPTK